MNEASRRETDKTAISQITTDREIPSMCQHQPPCPSADSADRESARLVAHHPEQGWSLLCNGVVIFDDGGALLPDGRAVLPPSARARTVAPAA